MRLKQVMATDVHATFLGLTEDGSLIEIEYYAGDDMATYRPVQLIKSEEADNVGDDDSDA